MITKDLHTCFIVDDHQIFYNSFRALMHKTNLFSQILCFNNADSLLYELTQNTEKKPFIFLDYYLEKDNALKFIKQIKSMVAEAKIIVLSSVSNPIIIKTILQEPIDGFISKTSSMIELQQCVNTLLNNNTYYCPTIQSIINTSPQAHPISLCAKEIEILHLFKDGLNIEQISKAMNMSKKAIVKFRNSILDKTNTSSISEVLYFIHKHKLSFTVSA